MRVRWLAGAIAITLAVASLRAGQDAAHSEAASMSRKLAIIEQHGTVTRPAQTAPVRTTFTDREANAYFKINGRDFLPAGVIDPVVSIDPNGHVRARAVVDLQQALKTKDRSAFDPLAWLGTSVEVTAAGTLRTLNGSGRFALESATLAGIPVPISVLQQVVGYYTRTPDLPQGFDLNQPFELPSKIRAVETQQGAATIVQ